MIKLKTILGLCVLSALAICAFAAQSASAASQTAYLCSKTPTTKVFSDAHCKSKTGTLEYAHKAIPPLTPAQVAEGKGTPVTLTNVTTGEATSIAKMKSVQSGVSIEFQATGAHGEGTLENTEEAGEMFAHGHGFIEYTGVTVTLPAGKGCKVPGGTVKTEEVTITTKGQAVGSVQVVPAAGAGGTFARFIVEGCSVTELNHEYTATGSVVGTSEGATTTFTHAATTAQKTLKLFGQTTGFDGTVTIKDKTTGEGVVLT